MSSNVIAIVNQKGGVGKTTTCSNLGIGLAQAGKRVLLIDCDPQASLTISLGHPQPDQLPITLTDVLNSVMEETPLQPKEGILRHDEGIDLMPSNIELSGFEVSLVNAMSREKVLKQYIDTMKHEYDYILIDCMPSLGMLTLNALTAASSVLIPVQAQYLPVKGLEQLLQTVGKVCRQINPKLRIDGILLTMVDSRTTYASKHFARAHKVNLVRYADDFIITAATKEIAMEAKELVRDFLKTRGLELSEEKTLITHIDEGFDMLSWTFRKFKGKLIVKPSKKAIKAFVATLSETIFKRGKAWNQGILIEKLNQQIRGWANYHQSVCASEAFSHIDYILYEHLWQWAKRRHPHKGQWWISTKYWRRKDNRNWVFSTEDDKQLLRIDHIPIVRHTKVRMDANPYLEPEYFTKRKFEHGMKRLSGRFKSVWKNQNGCCYHCGLPMEISDEREMFFKVPKSCGGKDEVSNMAYVHSHCQFLYTERRAKA